jgi:hypothetical protein
MVDGGVWWGAIKTRQKQQKHKQGKKKKEKGSPKEKK